MKHILRSLIALGAILPGLAMAQATDIDPTKGLYFNQKLGVTVPLDAKFKDENGKEVRLGDYFKDRPVILALVFYDCQSSCLLIRDGLLKSLNALKAQQAGRDFDVLVVSIKHTETPELALEKKTSYLGDYKYKGTENGWHFLTGSKESVFTLTQAVGFGFQFDEKTDMVSHPSGIIILTPEGETSLYLLGATYPQEFVRDGIKRAAEGNVGEKTEEILLGCLVYDPASGKYRPVVENMLKVGGILTVLILGGSIAVMSIKHKRSALFPEDVEGGKPTPQG